MDNVSASQLLYDTFGYLSDVRFNFWPYLFFIIPPLLVFSVNAAASQWQRIGRLIVAIALAYCFINLDLHTFMDHRFEAAASCRYKHAGPDPYETHVARKLDTLCPAYPNSGASYVFYAFLGWIPGAGYVGFWELVWRIWYRKQLKRVRKTYQGKRASNLVIGMFIFCLLVPICLYVSYLLLSCCFR